MANIFISSVDETVSNLLNGAAHQYLLSKEIYGSQDQVMALMYLKRMFPNDLVFEFKLKPESAFAVENAEKYRRGFWRVENSTCMDLLALIEVHPIWRGQTTFVLKRRHGEIDEELEVRKVDAAVKRMLKKIELSVDPAVFNKLEPVCIEGEYLFDSVNLSTSEQHAMLVLLREILEDTDMFKQFILGCCWGYGFFDADGEGREFRAVVATRGSTLECDENGNLYRLYRNESLGKTHEILKRELISEPLTRGDRTEFQWY